MLRQNSLSALQLANPELRARLPDVWLFFFPGFFLFLFKITSLLQRSLNPESGEYPYKA